MPKWLAKIDFVDNLFDTVYIYNNTNIECDPT